MITQIIIDIVFGIISDYLIQNIAISAAQKSQIAHKVQSIILEEFDNALQNLPIYDSLIADINFQPFFEQVTIQREISKFLSPNESPSVDNLLRIWKVCYSSKNNGLIKLAFENFIKNTEDKLLTLPHFIELISYKHSQRGHLNIITGIEDLKNEVGQIRKGFESSSDISGVQRIKDKYQNIIADCNLLIENNRPYAALDLLKSAEENWTEHNLSNKDKAKILNLIGNCFLVTIKYDEAKKYYQRAMALDPENYKYLANNALLELHLGKYVEAKELALHSQKLCENDIALSVVTEVEAWEKDYRGLDNIIKSECLDNSLYLFTLGSIFYKAKEYDKAIDYLQRYLAAQPNDFSANLFLGQIILENILPAKWTHAYELSIGGRRWKKSVDKVIDYSQKALDILSIGDNEPQKIEAQSSIAAALAIQGRLDEALKYLDEILRSQPNHRMALHNRIIVSIFKGDFAYALDLIQRLPKEYLFHPDFYAIASRVYIGANQPQKVIELLKNLSGVEFDEPNYYLMLAWAYYELDDMEGFDKVKEDLFYKSKMIEGNKHEILANILSIIGEKENAINELKASLNLAVDHNTQKRLKLRIADHYFNLKEFEQSVCWFEESKCDLLADPYITRNYTYSLFKSGEFKKAYIICKEFSETGKFDPVILDIRGRIAEYLTDFDTALMVEEEFIEKEIDTDFHRAQLARLLFRNRNSIGCLNALEKVNFEKLDDSYMKIQCAQLFLILGEPEKAIQLSLQAYIQDQSSIDININYIWIFLNVDVLQNLDTEKITTNTSFFIDDGQKKEWVSIVDAYKPNIRVNEFSPEAIVAQKYMGHSVGDEVILKHNEFETITVKILEIQSIYVRTFQEIADNFSSRFPNSNLFNKVNISRDDPSEFLMAVARMGLRLEQIFNLYNSRKLTIEQTSYLARKSPIDTFLLLQRNPPYKIFASKGLQRDNKREFNNLSKHNSVTITFSGLFTAANLGFLEYLPETFTRIFISQHLIDEIQNQMQREKELRDKGVGNVGYSRGGFTFIEIPENFIDKKISFFQQVLDFINKNCEQIPIEEKYTYLLIDPNSPEEFLNHVGNLTQVSLIIAKQTESLLYSDESLVRDKAESIGIESFWTQPLLEYLFSISKVSSIELSRYLSSLIDLNYFTPLLNEKIIFDLIKHNHFLCSFEVISILKGLSGEDINEDYAIIIGSKLISRIWIEPIPDENRFFLQEVILSAMIRDRKNKEIILYKLIQAIDPLLSPFHEKKQRVFADLKDFVNLAY